MTRRSVRFLGRFEVTIDGHTVTEFESATTRALLARIIAQRGEPLPRRALAELLWPDRPQGKALANLRHSLSVLRKAVGDHNTDRPLLEVSKTTVRVSNQHDVTVDVLDFWRLSSIAESEPGAVAAWEAAVALPRGPFLEGFDADISEDWDTWLLTERAAYQTQLAATLRRLAELRERTGERAAAMKHARNWAELDPWNEPAQRTVLRLLALDGRRNAAVVVGEGFVRALESELGVPASDDTMALIDDIRAGAFPVQAERGIGLPPRRDAAELTPFCVGRESELRWLDQRLDDAVGGSGGITFIAGQAGSGKSVLMQRFATSAENRMDRLTVLRGSCNAYTGIGDPFLPFRQVLGQLCGDLEREWARGVLTPKGASELWALVPEAVEAVLELGPQLLGTLIDAGSLLRRFEAGFADHPLTPTLRSAVEGAERRTVDPNQGPQPLVEQCTRVLARLGRSRPLLVIVDDLQWADSGTLDVILDLARHARDSSLMVMAAFRPPEVSSASVDPLQFIVNEVGTTSRSECTLEIHGTRAFVDACLDTEPNRLDGQFRDQLFRATGGHALLTVETIRSLKQHNDLTLDADDRWIAGPSVSWESLPPRVEATIAGRLDELPLEVRRDLEVAAVLGQIFSAEVVATARDVPTDDVILRLSSLDIPPDSLILPNGPRGVSDVGGSRYRFRHALFQQYLYDHIAPPLRRKHHEGVAVALEELFRDRLDLVDVDLAHHFSAAGSNEKAIEYCELAARRSMSLSANAEAIRHLEQAVELLMATPDSADRGRREVGLLTLLGSCHQAHSGYNAPATTAVYDRLRSLTSDLDPSVETAQALGALVTVSGLTARYDDALGDAERLLEVARHLDIPAIETVAIFQIGWMELMTGRLEDADRHLQEVIASYDPAWDEWLTPTVGMDLLSTALAWRSIALWHLGRPSQAIQLGQRSIALAREADYPFGLVFALAISGCLLAQLLKQPGPARATAREVMEIAEREDFPFYRAAGDVHLGGALILAGNQAQGFGLLSRGLERWTELGTDAFVTWSRVFLAMHLVADGQIDAAQREIDLVEAAVARGGDPISKFWLPLVHGMIRKARGDFGGAEVWFREAVEVARAAQARGPELQAATALAVLLDELGRPEEGRDALAPVLCWFTEGGDIPDLVAAKSLLDRL